eukprot:TRINITY_DN9214_c0_g1_i1.p1 TRINITY_DN9214_c0_g1~~TRINITY_DN9214_c0_g1_i1.p1  ORF type:complete len:242 (-),score=94.55 TRINITY_DN9214_c0_g1_i1:194-877(-)
MNDAAVDKQIANMVSFIKKEAKEKASEIQAKASEEFTIEKAELVQSSRLKIAAEYEKKEKQVLVSKKIAHSNELAKSRLEILKARDAGLQKILAATREKLDDVSKRPEYKDLLVSLILQGITRFESREIDVLARPEDQELAATAIAAAKAAYQKSSGESVTLTLSKILLPPSPKNAGAKTLKTCSGGIILTALSGKVTVDNTLDKRLEAAYHLAVPEVRQMLFAQTG